MEIIKYPIIPEKSKAWHIYMHPYFTKQSSNVVSAYIKNFTKEGDSVLDPFCGTGVTAIETLALRRKAIAVDINPLACFITEQTVAQIDTDNFLKEFIKIKDTAGKEIERIDKLPTDEIEKMKIKYWYPKGIKLPKNTDKGYDFVEQLWTKRQLLGLSLLWHEINRIEDESIRNQMKLVFSATISRVNITYNLSMTRQTNGKIKYGDGGSALFAQYRYWFPKNIIELPVWDRFNDRFRRILRAKEKWNEITKGFSVKDNFICINASVFDLKKYIPDGTIDYMYADPPYGGNIAYLDLSTMWNAWLGFEIDEKARKEEIIEDGELDKTQDDYEELFSKSFVEMSRVMKKDGILSLVFAHKKLEFWNLIIDSNENNGMEFKGSVFQPTNNSSIHYKKNPANVLCSQRIANFQKTNEKSIREKPDNLEKFILNEMERACLEKKGATIDIIYQRVLDKLLNNNTIAEAKKKGYLKLNKFLDNDKLFVFEPNSNRYFVKNDKKEYEHFSSDFFKNKDELKIFVKSILIQYKTGLSLDDIHKEVFEIFAEEKKFPIDKLHSDLQEVLSEIAVKSPKTNKWIIKTENNKLDFGTILTEKLIKIELGDSTHSETIFRLYLIGKYLGFFSWIGTKEQSVDSFMDFKFKDLSLPELPFVCEDKSVLDKIKQIDIIWLDKIGIPRYAFEIEESTNIMTGFERFKNMLQFNSDIARKLFIVAPQSRKRKIYDVFHNSVYIGHPLYFENKIGLIFKEKLVEFYDGHIENDFDEDDFTLLFEEIEN